MLFLVESKVQGNGNSSTHDEYTVEQKAKPSNIFIHQTCVKDLSFVSKNHLFEGRKETEIRFQGFLLSPPTNELLYMWIRASDYDATNQTVFFFFLKDWLKTSMNNMKHSGSFYHPLKISDEYSFF